MPEGSASYAERNFAALLDAVEHQDEHFTILRRGMPVARLAPVWRGSGAAVKALLRRHVRDEAWEKDLVAPRAALQRETGAPNCG